MLLGLSACEQLPTPARQPAPAPLPEINQDAVATPSEASQELAAYYARVESGLLAQGLLRDDGGGPDVPFNSRDVVENFVRIAMFEEYANIGGRIVARQTPSRLHRWETPVRMSVEFGASVPADQRRMDRANVTKYANRLGRVTGLDIRQTNTAPNYHVFIVNEDERVELAPRIRQILPGIDPAAMNAVVDMPRSTFCLVFAWDPTDSGSYTNAIAIIRGEHPDRMRLSCIHEELAQGMGLSNDSPSARPSVFNDDEEFGLLTTHDEILLQLLYDPRLRPGMNENEARTQAEIIASELLGGES